MDESELSCSLDIVFEKEMQDLHNGIHTFTIYDNSEEYSIRWSHADTLVQLYLIVRSNQTLRSFFVETLKAGVINSDGSMLLPPRTYLGISRLCFYTLVTIGCTDEAIRSLKKRKKGCEGLFNLIQYMLPKNYFNSNQLADILSKTKDESGFSEVRKFSTDIISYRYEILAKQINKINIEINQDKNSFWKK